MSPIAALLLLQASGNPLVEGKLNKDPYRMMFSVNRGTQELQVELSPFSADSSVKMDRDPNESLRLGAIEFRPVRGFERSEGSSADYTLGMDFLRDKFVGMDLRDGTFCIWRAGMESEVQSWFLTRLANRTSAVEVVKGKTSDYGISMNCRTEHGQVRAHVSLGAYGSTLALSLRSGLEVRLQGRPGLVSNALQIEQRKVLWPWFASEVEISDGEEAILSIATFKSRVVAVDFSRGEIWCESGNSDAQIAYTLQEALVTPVQIKGDEVLLGSLLESENKNIASVLGSKVRTINGVAASEALAMLRSAKPAQIHEVSKVLFGSIDHDLEIEKPDGKVMHVKLSRTGD